MATATAAAAGIGEITHRTFQIQLNWTAESEGVSNEMNQILVHINF